MREFVEEITGGRGRRRNEEDRQDRIGKDRRNYIEIHLFARTDLWLIRRELSREGRVNKEELDLEWCPERSEEEE